MVDVQHLALRRFTMSGVFYEQKHTPYLLLYPFVPWNLIFDPSRFCSNHLSF